ncbi:hypothetical protein FRB98_001940, partial [Tulasnella sp. 332]
MSSQPAYSARKAYRPPRPSYWGYDLRDLKNFPHRLLFPPNAGVGTVRSLKLTPRYEVSIHDVLDGKHLPPLTLKDFEEYLVFVEHSAENLYFICWLRDYKRTYNAWQHSLNATLEESPEKRPQSLPELTLSFSRARATFFDRDSHLELNLPFQEVEALLNNSKQYAHPPPSVLADVERQVESMLRESLMKFISSSCGNSGRRRGLFAIAVGALVIAIGLIPVILSVYHHTPRAIRLAGLPAFWFGFMTAIAGFHGVCVVIFLFGDARQLYPYELKRPLLAPMEKVDPLNVDMLPLPVTAKGPMGSGSNDGHSHLAKSYGGMTSSDTDSVGGDKIQVLSPNAAGDQTASVRDRSSHGSDWDGYDVTAGFIPPSTYAPSITSSNTNSDGDSVPFHFDFDSLPPPSPRRSSEMTDRTSTY